MKTCVLLLTVGAMFLAGCGGTSSTPAQGTNSVATNADANYNTGNPLTAPVDYLGAVGQAQKYAIKQIDLAYLNQAIQQFNAAEGRYPKDLNELVPNYVGKMPQAPYGYKIVYDAASGTVTVVRQ
jgi:hypothetical protein